MKLFNEDLITKTITSTTLEDAELELELALDNLDIVFEKNNNRDEAIYNLTNIKLCLLKMNSLEGIFNLFEKDFNIMGIVKDMSIETAIEHIDVTINTLTDGVEISEEIIITAIAFAATMATLIAFNIYLDKLGQRLERNIVRIETLSRYSETSRHLMLSSRRLNVPNPKAIATQFYSVIKIYSMVIKDLRETCSSMSREAYAKEFAKIDIELDIHNDKFNGKGILPTKKGFLFELGYHFKGLLFLMSECIKISRAAKDLSNRAKHAIETVKKFKGSNNTSEEANIKYLKSKKDVTFIFKVIKCTMPIVKRNGKILGTIASSINRPR